MFLRCYFNGMHIAYKLVYQVKGIFEGFQESGPLFDNYQSKMPPNMKLAGVGTIKVEEVYEVSPGPNCGKKLA